MTYDPIANTIRDPLPACPFCQGPMRHNAISAPPFLVHCDRCGAKLPAERFKALCVAMEGEAKAQRLIDQARALRWQLRMVLEFYQTPPPDLLKDGGIRYAVLIAAWQLTRGEV